MDQPPQRRQRVDSEGRAFAGSQRQIQTYVNERSKELSVAVAMALGFEEEAHTNISWVSPLVSQKYAEYRDEDFLRAVGLAHLASDLRHFWPNRGPCWDALARF
jgi:hypothetical protein